LPPVILNVHECLPYQGKQSLPECIAEKDVSRECKNGRYKETTKSLRQVALGQEISHQASLGHFQILNT